jgi:hypothetical protein
MRGRPKRMKTPVSINGENVAVLEYNLEQSVPLNSTQLDPVDPRDVQIAALEKRLKDFENRMANKASGIEPTQNMPLQKAKPIEPTIPLQVTVTARDLFEIEDRKPVTGIFRMNNKKPGEKGMIKIGCMRKYKGDHMRPWIFEHGKTHTVPKWLADWLNGGNPDPDAIVKSPGCNIITHNDQDNNLQEKRMLEKPTMHSLYSFSPIAKW